MPRTAEGVLHEQVCQYLRLQHPGVLFHSDYGSGVKLTMGQAVAQKKLQSTRAWPDLFIAEPRGKAMGLFLELKKEGTTLYKRDGSFVGDGHLNEQREVLETLRGRGYAALFTVGFDETKILLDVYLKGTLDAYKGSYAAAMVHA